MTLLKIFIPEDEYHIIQAKADECRKPISVLLREKLGLPMRRQRVRRGFGHYPYHFRVYTFAATEDEAEVIRRKAEEAGLSLSRYIRSILLDKEV